MLWEFLEYNSENAEVLRKKLNIPYFLSKLLCARGITAPETAEEFIKDELPLHNPFLLKDMDKAAKRIKTAVKNKEKICIFGDYDADGITATYLIYDYLYSLGCPVIYMLPDREDNGYGMNSNSVEQFEKQGINLVITVDTGITTFDEANQCKEKGIDLVITDHHTVRDGLPQAVAVVNPHRSDCDYPFKELAGVGVAFKLLCALSDENDEVILNRYSDLLALGTVADLVSVTDENRYFIKRGIQKLNSKPNLGIKALGEESGIESGSFTPSNVAFTIAPRINAAGRVASPDEAIKLILSKTEDDCRYFAKLLCSYNTKRREFENEIFKNAVNAIEENSEIKDSDILVVSGENWHQGVIGIVASKLVDKYKKPCILLTVDGKIAKGSARSIKGCNILNAVAFCKDILIKYGGHSLAAGIQLDASRMDEFRRRINRYSEITDDGAFSLTIDLKLASNELTLSSARCVTMLEPFGTDNRLPLFATVNAKILTLTPAIKGKHLRITLEDEFGRFTCMYFGISREEFPFDEEDRVDVAYHMNIGKWMNREKLTCVIKDIRFSGAADRSCADLPDKADFVAAYRYIARNKYRTYNLFSAALHITEDNPVNLIHMTYSKLKIIFEVLDDLKVIDANFSDDNVAVKINHVNEKVHLESSEISKKYHLFNE